MSATKEPLTETENDAHAVPTWLEELVGAELLFALLAKLLLAQPAQQLMEQLVADGLLEDIPYSAENKMGRQGAKLLTSWSQQKRSQPDARDYEAERHDYTRLFEGPGRVLAPPWESVHLSASGLTFQEQTLAARRWYRRYGLESLKIRNEPDDHIGLEVSFLAYLVNKTVAALEAGDAAEARRFVEAQQQFISEHLARWVDLWAQQVDSHARTDFWRGTAMLLHGAVTSWERFLESGMPEIGAA